LTLHACFPAFWRCVYPGCLVTLPPACSFTADTRRICAWFSSVPGKPTCGAVGPFPTSGHLVPLWFPRGTRTDCGHGLGTERTTPPMMRTPGTEQRDANFNPVSHLPHLGLRCRPAAPVLCGSPSRTGSFHLPLFRRLVVHCASPVEPGARRTQRFHATNMDAGQDRRNAHTAGFAASVAS